jgi:hypothetical protein
VVTLMETLERKTLIELEETLENLTMIIMRENSTAIMMDLKIITGIRKYSPNHPTVTLEDSAILADSVIPEDLSNSLAQHIIIDVFMNINIYCRINIYKKI